MGRPPLDRRALWLTSANDPQRTFAGSATRRLRNDSSWRTAIADGIPAVGTGIAGFPIDQCAVIMARSLSRALADGWAPSEIRFVLFGDGARRAFQASFEEVFGTDRGSGRSK